MPYTITICRDGEVMEFNEGDDVMLRLDEVNTFQRPYDNCIKITIGDTLSTSSFYSKEFGNDFSYYDSDIDIVATHQLMNDTND